MTLGSYLSASPPIGPAESHGRALDEVGEAVLDEAGLHHLEDGRSRLLDGARHHGEGLQDLHAQLVVRLLVGQPLDQRIDGRRIADAAERLDDAVEALELAVLGVELALVESLEQHGAGLGRHQVAEQPGRLLPDHALIEVELLAQGVELLVLALEGLHQGRHGGLADLDQGDAGLGVGRPLHGAGQEQALDEQRHGGRIAEVTERAPWPSW